MVEPKQVTRFSANKCRKSDRMRKWTIDKASLVSHLN